MVSRVSGEERTMRMTMAATELTRALYRVQGIADKKSTMPVLAHVLLRADPESGLHVSATDLDVGLRGSYPAQVESSGAVAVHAKQFYEIVKSLTEDSVSLEVQDNNWVEICSGASRFRLVGMNADEFPALPDPGEMNTFSVSSKELASAHRPNPLLRFHRGQPP